MIKVIHYPGAEQPPPRHWFYCDDTVRKWRTCFTICESRNCYEECKIYEEEKFKVGEKQ